MLWKREDSTDQIQFSDLRYYDPLRLPKVHLRFVRCSLSAPDTMHVQLVCDSKRHPEDDFQTYSRVLNGRLEYRENLVKAFLTPSLYWETLGSLKFPSYPFEYMPWSKTTVVSASLVITLRGLLPSVLYKTSAFLLHFI